MMGGVVQPGFQLVVSQQTDPRDTRRERWVAKDDFLTGV
jgi:hypothetical protein